MPGGAADTPVCPLTKSHSLQKPPSNLGPPSPITHPGMSPPRPQHCGHTWGGDNVL